MHDGIVTSCPAVSRLWHITPDPLAQFAAPWRTGTCADCGSTYSRSRS